MFDIGGEMPTIEHPEPRFGGVISSLNKLMFILAQNKEDLGVGITSTISELEGDIETYKNVLKELPKEHLAAIGAVHNEDKATVGLGNRDNYRNSTTAETISGTSDSTVITIGNAKKVIDQKLVNDLTPFQKNGIFKMCGFSSVTPLESLGGKSIPHTYGKNRPCDITIVNDRLLITPESSDSGIGFGAFITDPSRIGSSMAMEELPSAVARCITPGWSKTGSPTSNNRIMLSRPSADGKVKTIKNDLIRGGYCNFLLYDSFGPNAYHGIAAKVVLADDGFTVENRIFKIDNPTDNGVLAYASTDAHKANFNTVIEKNVSNPFSGLRTYKFTDFFTLGSGVTIARDKQNEIPCATSLVWQSQDSTYYLMIAIPVIFTIAGKQYKYQLIVTEVRTPGKYLSNSAGRVTLLKGTAKDTINADTDLDKTKWLKINKVSDLTNPVGTPGVILGNGMIVSARSFEDAIYVKYAKTDFTNTVDYIERIQNTNPDIQAESKVFSGRRYDVFGVKPERIIPHSINGDAVTYYCYSVHPLEGKSSWFKRQWSGPTTMSATGAALPEGYEQVKPPAYLDEIESRHNVPFGVVNTVYNSLTKIDTTGLVFCSDNDYKGYSTFSPEGSLDQTKIITLAPKDITALEDYRPTFRANQLKYYGISEANKDYNFEVTVSAFVISSFKVIVLWSDGLCYCEVGCFNYVNNNNVITLTSGPGTVPPTVAVPAGLKPNKGARTSVSKDSVGLRYMDFNVCMINNFDAYIGVPRAFGNLYGELVFKATAVTNFGTATVITPVAVTPAKTYLGTKQWDVADFVYPNFLLPRKGLFYNAGNKVFNGAIENSPNINPDLIPDTTYHIVPQGFKCIVNGTSYIVPYTLYAKYTGNSYCYLSNFNGSLSLVTSPTMREPSNLEILIGYDLDGVYTIATEYVVLDNHLLSAVRRGSSIPITINDGSVYGRNEFLYCHDILLDENTDEFACGNIMQNATSFSLAMNVNHFGYVEVDYSTGIVRWGSNMYYNDARPSMIGMFTHSNPTQVWAPTINPIYQEGVIDYAANTLWVTKNFPELAIPKISEVRSIIASLANRKGRDRIEITQQPAKANGYVLKILMIDNVHLNDDYSFDLKLTTIV